MVENPCDKFEQELETACRQRRSYSSAQIYGRTTGIEENPQPAENGFSHEGRSAAERAQAARSLARRKHLQAHPGFPKRQAPLRFARRAPVSHRGNSSWYRPEQNPQGSHRKVQEHGGAPSPVRPGMGLPRTAPRNA